MPALVVGCDRYRHNRPNASMPNLCQYPSLAATTPNASMPHLCQCLLLAATTTATTTALMLVCQIYASMRRWPPGPESEPEAEHAGCYRKSAGMPNRFRSCMGWAKLE